MPKVRPSLQEQEKSNGWTALDKYNNAGFVATPRPDKEPLMPRQISQITSDALGDLMSSYAVWREYTEDMLLKSIAKHMEVKTMYDYEYSKVFIMAEGSTDKQKKSFVDVNDHIHKLNIDCTNSQVFVDMLSNKLESFSNCITIISREITRRENLIR